MSSSQGHTIRTLWSTIETFLDLPSAVAVAQTCRALHGDIVDADTRRIKVTHFIIPRRAEGGPFGRIPNYLPRALNAIHWPSLKRIDFGPAVIVSNRSDVNDADFSNTLCFQMLATQLAYASNLESLQLDAGGILDNVISEEERTGDGIRNMRYEPIIEVLGHNLARCNKFNDLGISLSEYYCPYAMRELVLSLTPVLAKQWNAMSRVQFRIFCGPSYASQEEDAWNSLHGAAVGFFRSVLGCPNLQVLDIDVPHSPILSRALVASVDQINPWRTRSLKRQKVQGVGSQLHHLVLNLWGLNVGASLEPEELDEYFQGTDSLLGLFSNCSELEDLKLGLDCDFWRTRSSTVANLLEKKAKLSAVSINFGNFQDDDGKILKLLRDCIFDGDSCKIGDLVVTYLENVDGKGLFKLMQDIHAAGGIVNDYYDGNTWISIGEEDEGRLCVDRDHIPDTAKVGNMWARHEENFRRRERSLGPWY